MDQHDIAKKVEMLTSKKGGHLKKVVYSAWYVPFSTICFGQSKIPTFVRHMWYC
jgi:hypothetical protein